VTRKEVEGLDANWPQPKRLGQSAGTATCRALSGRMSLFGSVSYSAVGIAIWARRTFEHDLASCLLPVLMKSIYLWLVMQFGRYFRWLTQEEPLPAVLRNIVGKDQRSNHLTAGSRFMGGMEVLSTEVGEVGPGLF